MQSHAMTARLSALVLSGSSILAVAAEPQPDVVFHAGLSPAEAVKAATVPAGFEMKLFASEPDIVNPISFCIDERGRLWVVAARNLLLLPPRRSRSEPGRASGSEDGTRLNQDTFCVT